MPDSMGRKSGARKTPIIVVVAMIASIVILILAVANGAAAQSNSDDEARGTQKDGPLVVPVFPKMKKKDPSDDSEVALPKGADLRDSYIIMEDGSVLSVGDWIKGSLTKNDTGIGMSDYQNRMFLGQVARAMVGQDETMVNRSVVSVGPIRRYQAPAPISKPLQALQGLLGMIMPGDSYQWSPATDGGAFSRRVATEGGAAILFEEQFSEAVQQTAADFQETGAMINMLNAYKKAEDKKGGGN